KYIDVMEKTLYNNLLSGVGLDGKTFFYTNAMEVKDSHSHGDLERERSGWFVCSCCPTNMVRFLPSLPGYVYAQQGSDIYVNLFISGSAEIKIDKKTVQLIQQNDYPWNGHLLFKVIPSRTMPLTFRIRIPGWARDEAMPTDLYAFQHASGKKPELKINGKPVEYQLEKGYAVISRKWKKNDAIELELPMDVRRVVANDKVKYDKGKTALQRGPVMYCAEWKDNYGKTSNIILPVNTSFSAEYKNDLLHGVLVLQGPAQFVNIDASGLKLNTEEKTMTLIPYYSWANRGKGEMGIWFPESVKAVDLLSN